MLTVCVSKLRAMPNGPKVSETGPVTAWTFSAGTPLGPIAVEGSTMTLSPSEKSRPMALPDCRPSGKRVTFSRLRVEASGNCALRDSMSSARERLIN